MRTGILAAISLLATISQARSRSVNGRGFDCGVNITSADPSFVSAISKLAKHAGENASTIAARSASLVPALLKRQIFIGAISIPTYIHVLTTNASASSVTPFMVAQQLAVLNKVFNVYNIKFRLVKTQYIVNDTSATASKDDMYAMKVALREGTYSALNLYFHSDLGGSILGTCTLPTFIGGDIPDKTLYSLDGCNMAAQTMPGGEIYGYNLGLTAVHEIGHWLGLLHTFEGASCSGSGDFIGDTPAQSTATEGCPVAPPKDSCPTIKGVDMVNNYMDYSTDACYSKFTSGQISRIRTLWLSFRAGR